MASEWPIAPLGTLVKNFDSRRVPVSNREREKRRGRYPYHGATGVMDHIDDFLFDGLHLLIGEDGSVETPNGKPFLQLVDGKFWVNNHAHVLKGMTDDDTRFLFYALSTVAIRPFISGSVQAKLSQGNLNKIPIPFPNESIRKIITRILGGLDDKIELNRRMNATLEAMARALFQSWFVDFDPVRAKLDGRQPPYLDKATAALFPDSFQDSSLGPIPKGWQVAEVGQIADVIDCLHARKPDRCEGGRLYLQLNNIQNDGLIDITDAFLVSDADYQEWISRMEATQGDCVITNVGRVGAVAQIPEGVKAALGRNMTGIRCKTDFSFPTFLIECLLSRSMREEIRMKMDTGTILNALNVKNIPKLRFVRPPYEIATRFESLARPLRHKMEQNVLESRTLATLRDTLLPKLLSGKLSVANLKSKHTNN
jgi:type I restriction enzyme S subunit